MIPTTITARERLKSILERNMELDLPIAVNALNTPGDHDSVFCIVRPGAYRLAEDVAGVAGKHGIKIACSNVELYIQGFQLVGVPGSLDGIHCREAEARRIELRGGSVHEWGRNGISLSGADHAVHDVVAIRNELDGISVAASVVADCICSGNAGDGLRATGPCRVEACAADYNGGYGFCLSDACVARSCAAARNHGGFSLDRCAAERCTAKQNHYYGYVAHDSQLTGCSASLTAVGRDHTGIGFYLHGSSRVCASESFENHGGGFHLHNGPVAVQCRATKNREETTGFGFNLHGEESRVEACAAESNTHDYACAARDEADYEHSAITAAA